MEGQQFINDFERWEEYDKQQAKQINEDCKGFLTDMSLWM
jgi:hypothetical protein